MHLSPEDRFFHSAHPSRTRRTLAAVSCFSIVLNLIPLLAFDVRASLLALGAGSLFFASKFSSKNWKPIVLGLLYIVMALSLGGFAASIWTKELDRSVIFLLLLRVATGATWIATLTLCISWSDLTYALKALGLRPWIISFLDEAVASALLLLRGLNDSSDSVRQRFGKSSFSSVPWILATGLDYGFTRIRASQETRALRLAARPELSLPMFYSPQPRTQETPALEVSEISVVDHESGHRILKNVAFELQAGEWLGVFGASGSGKTTLLRALAGLTPVASGTIAFSGEARKTAGPCPDVGFVFQNPEHSVIGATGWEDACLGPIHRRMPKEEAEAWVCSLFSEFGMHDLRHRPVSRLSFGELKRLSLISALAIRPKLLLCDEPTSGLDAVSASRLIQTLSAIAHREEISILWASHDLHLLPRRMERGLVLAKGELVRQLRLNQERSMDFWARAGLWPTDHAMHAVTLPEEMH
jgi:energy-coupling factor transporter ATP-binding protein EcfA2